MDRMKVVAKILVAVLLMACVGLGVALVQEGKRPTINKLYIPLYDLVYQGYGTLEEFVVDTGIIRLKLNDTYYTMRGPIYQLDNAGRLVSFGGELQLTRGKEYTISKDGSVYIIHPTVRSTVR